jgi:hypothetical protein
MKIDFYKSRPSCETILNDRNSWAMSEEELKNGKSNIGLSPEELIFGFINSKQKEEIQD